MTDAPPPPSESEAPAGLDAQKAADALFSTSFARDVNLIDPGEHLDKPLAEIEAENDLFRSQTYELALSEPQAAEFAQMLKAATVERPTDEQHAAWQKETSEQLVRQYGQEGARERLDLVTKWLSREPGIAQRIIDAGLVGHPRLAEVAVELAWSARARGEF